MNKLDWANRIGKEALQQGLELGIIPAVLTKHLEIAEMVNRLQDQGVERMQALTNTADHFGVSVKTVYNALK